MLRYILRYIHSNERAYADIQDSILISGFPRLQNYISLNRFAFHHNTKYQPKLFATSKPRTIDQLEHRSLCALEVLGVGRGKWRDDQQKAGQCAWKACHTRFLQLVIHALSTETKWSSTLVYLDSEELWWQCASKESGIHPRSHDNSLANCQGSCFERLKCIVSHGRGGG